MRECDISIASGRFFFGVSLKYFFGFSFSGVEEESKREFEVHKGKSTDTNIMIHNGYYIGNMDYSESSDSDSPVRYALSLSLSPNSEQTLSPTGTRVLYY